MFVHKKKVTLRDADAAGFLFFARHPAFAHEAYEEFMEARGLGLSKLVGKVDFVIPVVHAESDYRLPLWLGETVAIHLNVEEVRKRRFTIACELRNEAGKLACRVKTVHVAADKKTGKSIPLPEILLKALKRDEF
jgi:YbgC/YbaW family acyl-CoA thioester hydrolase